MTCHKGLIYVCKDTSLHASRAYQYYGLLYPTYMNFHTNSTAGQENILS